LNFTDYKLTNTLCNHFKPTKELGLAARTPRIERTWNQFAVSTVGARRDFSTGVAGKITANFPTTDAVYLVNSSLQKAEDHLKFPVGLF
jgi:hypothetical protein